MFSMLAMAICIRYSFLISGTQALWNASMLLVKRSFESALKPEECFLVNTESV